MPVFLGQADVERIVAGGAELEDRKSTRLNSSHDQISYAVFCLKKKKKLVIELTHVFSSSCSPPPFPSLYYISSLVHKVPLLRCLLYRTQIAGIVTRPVSRKHV